VEVDGDDTAVAPTPGTRPAPIPALAANAPTGCDAGGVDPRETARSERRAPICPWCGVTALPGSAVGSTADFVCDNADCEAVGEPVA